MATSTKTSLEEQRRVTAWAVKAGREYREMSRDDLAERLAEATGDTWDYERISNLENGRKTVSVELMAVLTDVLDLPMQWFVHGPMATLQGRNEHSGRYHGWPGRGLRDLLPSVDSEPAFAAGF